MKNLLNLLLLTTVILVFSSCNSKTESKSTNKNLEGTLKIDGSSTVYPITEAVAEEFRNEFPKVQITIGVSGTGGGFKKFGRGEIDLSNASRLIKDKEADECKANSIGYVDLMVAYDGMAVIINPNNDWAKDITVEELKKLWEPEAQGKILKWNQIRPEWPNKEIHLFGPGTASGTYDYFTEAIVGKSGSSRGDFTASEDDNVLVQGIKNDELALGFFGFAYYQENKDILKLLPVDNGNGPIYPSIETVTNGTYSPLSRPLYIYANSNSTQKTELVEFVNYYLTNVKVLCKETGYIPLSDEKYIEQEQKFSKFLEDIKVKK